MDEENQAPTPTQTENDNKINPVLIIGIIIIVAIVGIGIFLTRQKGTTSQNIENLSLEDSTSKTSSDTQSQATEAAMTTIDSKIISVEGGAFYFKPNQITVKKGERVTIEFKNAGGTHDLVIDEFNVKTKLTNSGETTTVEFTPDKAGTFEFYCSVSNHKEMGMSGTLIVE